MDKVKMTDKYMYDILTRFANDHPCAYDTTVSVSALGRDYKTNGGCGYYEDFIQLDRDVSGAERFILWARRKGIVKIRKVKK